LRQARAQPSCRLSITVIGGIIIGTTIIIITIIGGTTTIAIGTTITIVIGATIIAIITGTTTIATIGIAHCGGELHLAGVRIGDA